jgi:site-specific recombinase XerD
MFKTLFRYNRVISRHANAPLAAERITFLSHLASQGFPQSTLLRYARQLRVIATMLGHQEGCLIAAENITQCADRWARRQRRQGRSRTFKWPAEHFFQVACAWYSFMGWLKTPPPRPLAYTLELETWNSYLRTEAQLAPSTVSNYCWWSREFLRWLSSQKVPLRQLTLAVVDQFITHLASRGLSRVTLAAAVNGLRRFLRFAFQQGWFRRDVSLGILVPRLFRHESLPMGPAWPEVQRLMAATTGDSNRDIRNRAILLLLAVYGLRSGEVRNLCMEDLDWTQNILRVRRSKTARVQEYPLTRAMRQSLQRYLKRARPNHSGREVFLTLRAPSRPLSASAVYDLTSSLTERLNISSPKHGPHGLRHACAAYLLKQGFTLKKVGDHLGHRCLSATQIYAKVDLEGLRTVAAFDLGGLL